MPVLFEGKSVVHNDQVFTDLSSPIIAAKTYHENGLFPIPLLPKTKKPWVKWGEYLFDPVDAQKDFEPKKWCVPPTWQGIWPTRRLTLLPKSGPGGSSPMRPDRWSYLSWPVPASGSRCSSGAVVGYLTPRPALTRWVHRHRPHAFASHTRNATQSRAGPSYALPGQPATTPSASHKMDWFYAAQLD